MPKLVPGVNDLATLFPDVAAEADGWDPSTVTPGSGQKLSWKCNQDHRWDATVSDRVRRQQGCPCCCNRKLWTGFND